MIETQILKENDKEIAVIIDIQEYKRLKELEQDQKDYESAIKTKRETTEWISHKELKEELGIE